MRGIPNSPKIERLDANIAAEQNPVARGCLRAERAGFLARQGYFDEARMALEELQKEFQLNPSASVSIWLQISSGWMAHYDDKPAAARDHLQRAYALSAAAGLDDLCCLSSAWLSHLAYSRNDFIGMHRNMKAALRFARNGFHSAQTRLNMVIALSYHFARRLDLAKPWYEKCREHALAEGDDGSISALNFNMAALQANHAIQASVFGGDVTQFSGMAIVGATSAESFDQLVSTASRKSWVYMVRAYTCSALGKYQEANRLYCEHINDACDQGMQHQRAFFLADRAWCRWNLGDTTSTQDDISDAISLVGDEMYVEDRAVAYGRLGQVLMAMGDDESSRKFTDLALKDWSEHEKVRCELLVLLEDFQK